MTRAKQKIVTIIGLTVSLIGVRMRLYARDIAWPTTYSFSGPRENTVWAIQERAYQDVGLVLFVFGLVVLLVALIRWLWEPPTSSGSNRNIAD